MKTALHDLTRVPPERQKILGLVKGKLPPDQGRMCVPWSHVEFGTFLTIRDSSDLKLTTGKKFTLLGTPEGDEIKDPARLYSVLQFLLSPLIFSFFFEIELGNLPDVVNDLDIDFTKDPNAVKRYKHDQRNIRKVKEMTDKLSVNIIHPLREGKKLLVLDIDYSAYNA